MKAPLPNNEADRLHALHEYGILDTDPEEVFNEITRLTAHLCGTPIALVTLLDECRQWFKSKVGLTVQETPRDIAFCSHAILQTDIFVVPDTWYDSRFATNPLVTGDPYIRFYAAAPLITSKGYALGTLCVIDRVPRELTPEQVEALQVLSHQVIAQLELRLSYLVLARIHQQQESQEISRLKSEFLTTISHELRTPLTSILGFSSVLLQQVFGTLTVKQQEYLSRIHSSGKHLLDLINDLLDLAKIEAGKLELEFEPIDLAELCREALQLVEVRALAKHLNLSLEMPVAISSIVADRQRVLQILLNYLSNAVKFTKSGGKIALSSRLASSLELESLGSNAIATPPESFLVLSVTDTGIGIPQEKQHLLFQTFQQVDGAINRQHEGTGLGLALTRRLAELHGGTVSFTSTVSVGSTFSVWLPLSRVQPTCSIPRDSDRHKE